MLNAPDAYLHNHTESIINNESPVSPDDAKNQENSELKSKYIEIKRTESKIKDLLSDLNADYHKGFHE